MCRLRRLIYYRYSKHKQSNRLSLIQRVRVRPGGQARRRKYLYDLIRHQDPSEETILINKNGDAFFLPTRHGGRAGEGRDPCAMADRYALAGPPCRAMFRRFVYSAR